MKRALVTGGSRGLGAALCALFLEKGYEVLTICRSAPSLAGVRAYRADLCDPEQARRVAGEIRADVPGLDVLVNNAGLSMAARIVNMSEKEYDQVVQVNFNAPRILTESLRPLVKGGSVVNIVSRVGIEGRIGLCNYAASKGLLLGYSRAMAAELARDDIRIFAVNPGFMVTGLVRPGLIDVQKGESLLGRISDPAASAGFVYRVSQLRWGSGTLFDFDSRLYKSWNSLS